MDYAGHTAGPPSEEPPASFSKRQPGSQVPKPSGSLMNTPSRDKSSFSTDTQSQLISNITPALTEKDRASEDLTFGTALSSAAASPPSDRVGVSELSNPNKVSVSRVNSIDGKSEGQIRVVHDGKVSDESAQLAVNDSAIALPSGDGSVKIGDYNFSFVTISPNKAMQQSPVFKRIKLIQIAEKKNWKGVDVEASGKPGHSTMWQKRRVAQPKYEKREKEVKRMKLLRDCLMKMKEIEDSGEMVISGVQGNLITTPISGYVNTAITSKCYTDYLNFRAIRQNQMLKDSIPSNSFSKSSFMDPHPHDLLYKVLKTDARIVRSVLEAHGFQHTEGHDWNIMWTNTSTKTYLYEGLNEHQRINHFPNSIELTHKDKLCANVVRMQDRFGKDKFDIIPDTYILPDQFADFYAHYHKLKQTQQTSNMPPNSKARWIVKPTALSRGRGIYLVDDISDVPIDELCVVSRYISNPLLINGLKFDIRLYVLVTSFDPLRVYLFNEGLTRFATEQYQNKDTKSRYVHLTNYSVNKKSDKFVQNSGLDKDDVGNKQSLSALNAHLEQMGVDLNLLWSRIYDVIIKALISVDHIFIPAIKKSVANRTNCFEVFGFDILIDSDLRPWIMEVNLSPSLTCDSPLDHVIKSNLIADTFTLIGIKKFERKRDALHKMKNRLKSFIPNAPPKNLKHESSIPGTISSNKFAAIESVISSGPSPGSSGLGSLISRESGAASQLGPAKQGSLNSSMRQRGSERREYEFADLSQIHKQLLHRISKVPPKHKDVLFETLLEDERRGGFIRIFPAKGTDTYEQYFVAQHQFNKSLYRYLYSKELFKSNSPSMKSESKMQERDQSPDFTIHSTLNRNKMVRESAGAIGGQKPSVFGDKKSPKHIESSSHLQQSYVKIMSLKEGNRKLDIAPAKRHQTRERGSSNPVNTHNFNQQQRGYGNLSPPHSQQQQQQGKLPSAGGKGTQESEKKGEKKNEKILITGDDVLIEYVNRLMVAVRSMKESSLKSPWKNSIEKFITHKVWHSSDMRRADNNRLWQRLESRLIEMRERRKRLIKSIYKKEGKTIDFDKEYPKKEQQKAVIIQGFSALQLEEMLRTSTKNVAYEVVSCLIDTVAPRGVLTEIIKYLSMFSTGGEFSVSQHSILQTNEKKPRNSDTLDTATYCQSEEDTINSNYPLPSIDYNQQAGGQYGGGTTTSQQLRSFSSSPQKQQVAEYYMRGSATKFTGTMYNKHITPRNSIPSIQGSKKSPSRGRSPLHTSSMKIGALGKTNNSQSFNIGSNNQVYESVQGRVSSAMNPEQKSGKKTMTNYQGINFIGEENGPDYSSSPSRVIRQLKKCNNADIEMTLQDPGQELLQEKNSLKKIQQKGKAVSEAQDLLHQATQKYIDFSQP